MRGNPARWVRLATGFVWEGGKDAEAEGPTDSEPCHRLGLLLQQWPTTFDKIFNRPFFTRISFEENE